MSKHDRILGAACAFMLLGALPAAAQAAATQQQAAGTLSKSDQRYFEDLAQANLAEIQTGKLAQGKAASADVKQFAQHMVDDHGKKLEEQRTLAKGKNVALPGGPEGKHKDAMKKLEKLSGAEFDRAYMDQMVKDHEATLKLVKNIASKADDPELKAAAQKAMPDIEKHLEMAKKIAATVKGDSQRVGTAK